VNKNPNPFNQDTVCVRSQACGAGISSGQDFLPKQDWATRESGHEEQIAPDEFGNERSETEKATANKYVR
jgi:hypothetical protein